MVLTGGGRGHCEGVEVNVMIGGYMSYSLNS